MIEGTFDPVKYSGTARFISSKFGMKKEGEEGVFAFLELRSTVFALFPSNVPERAVHKSRAARSLRVSPIDFPSEPLERNEAISGKFFPAYS